MDEGVFKLKIRLNIILLLTVFTLSAKCQSSQPDIQIITSHELESSGITILSDIFRFIDKWNISSIDGFNWSISANGLSPFQRQRFKILVDEHPVDINILDNQNINLLPFSVNQIEFIEVTSLPKPIPGDFAEGGLLHIHLKKPAERLTSHFLYSTGNETGDPGPYKFTPYTSPNVDKINNVFAADLYYGSRNWNLQLGIKNEQNYVTDTRINKRIQYFLNSGNKAHLLAGFGALTLNYGKSTNNLLSFYSDQNDYFNFRYYGNEIPVNRNISYGSVRGKINLNKRIQLNYLLQSSVNNMFESIGPSIDWNNRKLRSDLSLNYELSALNLKSGISLRRDALTTSNILNQNSISFRNFFLDMKYSPGRNSVHTISYYSVNNKNDNSYKISASHFFRMNKDQVLFGSFALFTRMIQEELNFWSWNINGYQSESGTSLINKYGDFTKSTSLTGDLIYQFGDDTTFCAEAGLFYRKFRNQYLEDQLYFYNASTGNFSTTTNMIARNSSSSMGISFGITQQLVTNLRYKIFYTYMNPADGSNLFHKIWKTIPAHKVSLSLDYSPSLNFGIWSRISYFSRTDWAEFTYIKYESKGLYDEYITNGIIWDLALMKFFAKRFIKTNVILRNLLNQKEYYNPIGAQFNLRLFIQIIINLDNLPE